jgi:tetratricopeptide (TPR) repeat protein
MKSLAGLAIALFGLLLCSLDARAQVISSQAEGICNGAIRSDPPARIEACRAVVAEFQINDYFRAENFGNLGAAYARNGEYDKAISSYSDGIRAIRDHREPEFRKLSDFIRHNRAAVYTSTGNYETALDEFNELLSRNQDDYRSYNSRCWLRVVQGKELELALADCNKALELKPERPDYRDSRGFVFFRMGKYDSAIVDFNAVLERDPKLAESLYIRGLAKLKSGDAAGGASDIAAAKAIKPKVAETYAGYGVAP